MFGNLRGIFFQSINDWMIVSIFMKLFTFEGELFVMRMTVQFRKLEP